jgi:hypothetical protein
MPRDLRRIPRRMGGRALHGDPRVLHSADPTCPQERNGGTNTRIRAGLQADLADATVSTGCLHHPLPLAESMPNWFLDVDVLARLHRPDGGQRMPMMRSGNADDIDAWIVQRPAYISYSIRRDSGLPAGNLSHSRVTDVRVDIAHIQDASISPTGKEPQMRIAAPSDTHHSDPKLVQRTAAGRFRFAPGFLRRGGSQRGGKHRFLKELATVSAMGHKATRAFRPLENGSITKRQRVNH